MKIRQKKNNWLILLGVVVATGVTAGIPPGQWQCLAYDSKEQSYEGYGTNMNLAMQAASTLCHKTSHRRKTCKTAQSFCEQGPISLIDDRCIVTDDNGQTWNTTGHDACKSALELCYHWQYLHGVQSQCTIKHG